MHGALLGPEFDAESCLRALQAAGLPWARLWQPLPLEKTVNRLCDGQVGGWFQGRMEFGPRALGNCRILADPRNREMQGVLNQKIKFRKGFRPFAPTVLEEEAASYFALDVPSPYMLFLSQVAREWLLPVADEPEGLDRIQVLRSAIPAVIHVDNSARVQTVDKVTNSRLRQLLELFFARTGGQLPVNTSFNVKDEPIVCSPEDAVICFTSSGVDFLVLGDYWSEKESP